MTLRELQSHMLHNHPELVSSLFRDVHGWRGLFDNLCHEWTCTPVRGKVEFLRQLMEHYDLRVVIAAYRDWCQTPQHQYIGLTLDDSLNALYKAGLEEVATAR